MAESQAKKKGLRTKPVGHAWPADHSGMLSATPTAAIAAQS